MKRAVKGFFPVFGCCLIAAGFLLDAAEVQNRVLQSVLYCLTALLPSLFPFLALSSFVVRLGIGSGTLTERVLAPVMRLFGLPPCCGVPVLLSFLGGYPSGAKSASILLQEKKITREEAGRMLCFCVNPGVAFVVSYLGSTVLGSAQYGWLLFGSVSLAGVCCGLLAGLFARKKSTAVPLQNRQTEHTTSSLANALVAAVADASRAMLMLCSCIVLFSALTALLHHFQIAQLAARLLTRLSGLTPQNAAAMLSFFWEVTGGVGAAQRLSVSPAILAFGVAFAGLCVHLQVLSQFSAFPLKYHVFLLFRVLHGALAAVLFHLFAHKLLPQGREVFLSFGSVSHAAALSSTAAGGASLFLMALAFLCCLTEEASPLQNTKKG